MLARSFVFLPGIGPTREARLWRRGVDSWGAYQGLSRVPGIRPHVKRRHDEVLALAERALAHDATFFARLLPPTEHWRAYDDFHPRAAYVDIETTGDRRNLVTVVGVRMRGENRAFVRCEDGDAPRIEGCGGVPYTPEAVADFVKDATCLVTFNGASFDLPVLRDDGVRFPDIPHVDLRLVFARIGITGGLKRIEEAMGLGREGDLKGLSGWDAVKMWRKWEVRRDENALRTLLGYNVADFANLEPLAQYACHTLGNAVLKEAVAQQRLREDAPRPAPVGP